MASIVGRRVRSAWFAQVALQPSCGLFRYMELRTDDNARSDRETHDTDREPDTIEFRLR